MSIIWSWNKKRSNVFEKKEVFEGKGNIWPTKSLMHWNPKWLYCKEDLSALLKSLLLCFAACGARHHLSFLAKMGTSLMSPTECQNWKLPQQFYAKGPKSQRLGVFHWMWVHTHSSFFFFLYFNWHFPQLWGCFFLSLYAKWLHLHAQSSWILLWLLCSYEYNRGQTSVFWGKKINRCPK